MFTLTIGIVNVTISIHSIAKLIITTKWAKRLTTWKCILCELNVEKGLRAPLMGDAFSLWAGVLYLVNDFNRHKQAND